MPEDVEVIVGRACFRIALRLIVDYHFNSAEATTLVNTALKECGLNITVSVTPDDSMKERYD